MSGGQAKAILISVYGNRAYEDTLLELKETLLAVDFRCVAGVAAVAEHSIMHNIATARPDEMDLEELKNFATKIEEKLKMHDAVGNLMLPGNSPYRQYNGVPIKPVAGKNVRSVAYVQLIVQLEQFLSMLQRKQIAQNVFLVCVALVSARAKHAL